MALDVLVEMLEHPDRYKYVEVEAYEEALSLDDVVATESDGAVVAKQVKFSTDPSSSSDPWTWEDLLYQQAGKKGPLDSLLQKWYKSTLRLSAANTLFVARVVSNRLPGDDLRLCLMSDGHVDFDKIPNGTRDEVLLQIGTESETKWFFSVLIFELDRPGLDVLDESVSRRFHNLGGTNEGWLSLKNEIRHWVCHKTSPPPDGRIRLEDIKAAAQWRRLEGLPQDFEVPRDYVLPSKEFRDHVVAAMESGKESCAVITGRPGVGKSTFLSYLYKHLRETNIPVVRHHYFLSLSRPSVGRFDYRRIASSLMHDLSQDYKEALGHRNSDNPSPLDLHEWIRECGGYFRRQGKCLVVIVDGLDHLWREKHSLGELNSLLEHLLPLQEGIILLLGTQPLPKELTPARLLSASPEWLELPLLDKQAVRKWVGHHVTEMHLPENRQAARASLASITNAFFSKSEGHPLHLAYTLRALSEQTKRISPESITAMPGCSHQDITTYYDQLWNALDEEGREILHLFAAAQLPWQQPWVIECLDPNGHNIPARSTALKQTRHLLVDRGLGLLPFHSSLLVYIQGLEDHSLYSTSLKRRAIEWLDKRAPEYWKWAYEWILKADVGDSTAIVQGPSRRWLVESIEMVYPRDRAAEVLARSVWVSLENDLPRSVEVGLLNDYLYNNYEFKEDTVDQLLYAQLYVEKDPYLMRRLDASMGELSDAMLVYIAERAGFSGNQRLARRCCDELYRRIFAPSIDEYGYNRRDQWSTVDAFLRSIAFDEKNNLKWFTGFVKTNRKTGQSVRMLVAYSRALRNARGVAEFRYLLTANLTKEERAVVIDQAVEMALSEQLDLTDVMNQKQDRSNPYVCVYQWLRNNSAFIPEKSAFPDTAWLEMKEHEQFDQTGLIEGNYRRLFWVFLNDHLRDRGADGRKWIAHVGQDTWPKAFLAGLESVAEELAELLKAGSSPSFRWLYDQFAGLARPRWPEDRDVHKYGSCAVNVIGRLAFEIVYLNADRGAREIGRDDLEAACQSPYLVPVLWKKIYLDERNPLLDGAAVDWLLAASEAELQSSISEFNERAEEYSVLAGIAALHNRTDQAKHLIHRTADNILTYGHHKDVLLFGLLDAIEACYKAGVPEARTWLISLAPVIANVDQFTDGDETGHLPAQLGAVLVRTAPDLAPSYHKWLIGKEEYHDAFSVIHSFVRYADLTDPISKAVASTAIDDDSIIIMVDRAAGGDPHAEAVVSGLKARLGHSDESIARVRASLDRSSGNGLPEKVFPPPDDFPPGMMRQYIEACKPEHDFRQKESVEHWLLYWIGQGRASDVYNDARLVMAAGVELGNEDIMHDLVLQLLGRDAAYPWLVKAHKEGYGWNRYWTSKDKATRRWEVVKRHYPDKWFDFIVDTSVSDRDVPWQRLGFYERFDRLIEYCLFMDQVELAKQITAEVLSVVFGLVSPLALPTPEWVSSV